MRRSSNEEVRTAPANNARELERMTRMIGFISLTDYVTSHKRAARVIAALRRRDDLQQTSLTNLRRECRKAGVDVQMVNRKFVPAPGSEMGFLHVLHRRRYAVTLIPGRWEQYEASSRKGVGFVKDKRLNNPACGASRVIAYVPNISLLFESSQRNATQGASGIMAQHSGLSPVPGHRRPPAALLCELSSLRVLRS
jgi:hypothetical protein